MSPKWAFLAFFFLLSEGILYQGKKLDFSNTLINSQYLEKFICQVLVLQRIALNSIVHMVLGCWNFGDVSSTSCFVWFATSLVWNKSYRECILSAGSVMISLQFERCLGDCTCAKITHIYVISSHTNTHFSSY